MVAGVSVLTTALGIFFAFSFVNAQAGMSQGNMRNGQREGLVGGEKPTLSSEAIAACDDASEKDTCSFTSSDASDSISGICKKNPKNEDELACVPERKDGDGKQNGMQKGGMQLRSSEEAITACSSKDEKAECSFSMTKSDSSEEIIITGTCMKAPAKNNGTDTESKLACVPEIKDGKKSGENQLQRAEGMKKQKSEKITRIESRAEKIISFLQSKDIDTDNIESNLSTFKDKADNLLEKIDAYIALLKADDSSDDNVRSASEAIRISGKDMMDYFNDTLKASIQDALDELKN